MPAKLMGIKEAKLNLRQKIDAIKNRKAPRAVAQAVNIIAAKSALMTPIDLSTLINSQYQTVEVKGTKITGKVGYAADYAIYVHEAPGKYLGTNTPRPNAKGQPKGSRGNIWDTGGEPKFLEKGAEQSEDEIREIFRKEVSL